MYKPLFWVTLAGFLFSGYLSGTKFFSGDCAFNEACPYFFTIPACYIGFILFALLFLASILLVLKRLQARTLLQTILGVGFLGILYAGWFTLKELPVLFDQGLSAYILGLPTCAMGFVFYVIVTVLGVLGLRKLEVVEEPVTEIEEISTE